MSISTPQTGGDRRPSGKPAAGGKPFADGKKDGTKSSADTGATKAAGGKTASGKSGTPAGKPSAGRPAGASARSGNTSPRPAKTTGKPGGPAKTTGKPGGPTKTAGSGGKRPPITPVKVSKGRPWGTIVISTVAALVAAGIIGFGVYEVHQNSLTWQDKANAIPGIVDYFKTEPDYLKAAQHQYGSVTYKQSPPVGGPHNPNWMQCNGNVYTAQIANEHAVHSLEHGAVWITYRPDLPAAQVAELAAKVKGNDYMLMSPYPGLDKPISLQAWGYQLKVDNASDGRIDQFIKDLKVNDSQEPGAVCSSGNYINTPGTTPHDLGASANPSATMG